MKVQNFIIGFPRCGTSYLREFFKINYPSSISIVDEPQFFHNVDRDEKVYENYFKNTVSSIDISPTYILDPSAIDRILEYNKDARFLVIIREPQSRDDSARNYVKSLGHNANSENTKAWMSCGKNYNKYISDLLKKVKKEHTHFVTLDEITKDGERSLRSIIEFFKMNCNENFRLPDGKSNSSKIPRISIISKIIAHLRPLIKGSSPILWSKLRNSVLLSRIIFKQRHTPNRPQISDGSRVTLDNYRTQIADLENLTGKDLSSWKEPC